MYKSKKPYLYGTGRRKSSVARVRLYEGGTGKITINGRDIDDVKGFCEVQHRLEETPAIYGYSRNQGLR